MADKMESRNLVENKLGDGKCATEKAKKCPSVRYTLAIMGSLGVFNVYSLRVSMSAAIVAMVNYTAVNQLNTAELQSVQGNSNLTIVESCAHLRENASVENTKTALDGEFVWDDFDQGQVLAAYFYGYVVTQTPGAWLGRRFGRVRVWGLCLLFASITTLLTPLAATHGGVLGIMVIRVGVGLFSGVSYPLMHGMWGEWAPPSERSFLTSIHFAGAPLGTIFILPLSGFLSKELGWQSVFYVTGTMGVLWSIAWLLLIFDSPAEHPRISEDERNYIQSSLSSSKSKIGGNPEKKMSVPWLKMFTSPPFLSVAFAQFSSNFGSYIVLTMLPTYLVTILHFDAKESGVISAIPYVFKLLLLLTSGTLVDWIIGKGVRTIVVRKIFGVTSLLIPGIGIVLVSYLNCNVPATMAFFALVVGLDAFTVPGFKACLIDIAPAFCGIMFSIGNTLSSAAGFAAPQIVSAFREANTMYPINGWRAAFGLGAGIYCLGGLGFLIFGSSDKQQWAEENNENEVEEEEDDANEKK